MIRGMSLDADDPALFAAGSTAVHRDTAGDRVWSAAPYRVMRDPGRELLLARWPGVEILAPTTWIEWLQTGAEHLRKKGIANLAAASGSWGGGPGVTRPCSAGSALACTSACTGSCRRIGGPVPGR